jgi:hypothetical protein
VALAKLTTDYFLYIDTSVYEDTVSMRVPNTKIVALVVHLSNLELGISECQNVEKY